MNLRSILRIHFSQLNDDEFTAIVQRSKIITLTSIYDIPELTDYIEILESLPKIKECFSNAYECCERIPHVEYVEGFMLHIFPIHHAFNKIGDTYFDLTSELCLGAKEGKLISVCEFSKKEMYNMAIKANTKGNFLFRCFHSLIWNE